LVSYTWDINDNVHIVTRAEKECLQFLTKRYWSGEDDPSELGCSRQRTTSGLTPSTPAEESHVTESLGWRYETFRACERSGTVDISAHRSHLFL